MKKLYAFDLVILAYAGILTSVVLVARPAGTAIYLACHAAAVALIALIVRGHARHGGRFWTFARYWYVVPIVLAAFRELHHLVPEVHPFSDRRYDHLLAALDRRWFGDVEGLFSVLPLPMMDLLHLCYGFYFVAMVIPGAALYVRKEFERLREYTSVILTAMFLSYLGYLVVPAVGPHHFYSPRPAQLDGWVVGGFLHRAIMAAEGEMADAFPSGHALLSMVVIAMAWKHHRPSFFAILLPALGCILATMALRYHYVVDVAASTAIFPGAILLGVAFHRWRERS